MGIPTIVSRFAREKCGNFSIAFAFASFAIFLAIGLAVDFSLSVNQRVRVNNALDAASLATARALSIGEISESGSAAEDYFKAIFAANLGLSDLTKSSYSVNNFKIDTAQQTVSATADYNQNLIFTRVGSSQTTQTVASKAEAAYGIGDIEVAMVVDVTESMNNWRITALKEAAELGVKKLLSPNTATDTHVRVSLVPYSNSINAGPLATYVYPDFNEAKSNAPVYDSGYRGNYDVKTFLESYDAECEYKGLNAKGKKKYTCVDIPDGFRVKNTGVREDSCATDRKAPISGTSYQYTDENPSKGMISRDSRLSVDGCTSSKLVPLTANESKLVNRIKGLSVGGCTAGHIGLQWAWYTISHKWADYVAEESKPDSLATNDKLAKYIILMTDGVFNTAYAGTNASSVNCTQSALSLTHTDKLCTNIKAAGIKIFTIGFGTPDSADTMLSNCASPDDGQITYAYEPDSAQALTDTYEHIANLIQSLRLTQ